MSNSQQDINEHFRADLDVSLSGLTSGGKFDGEIAGSKQYSKFAESITTSVSCKGGSNVICEQLVANPGSNSSYELYSAWAQSSQQEPDATTFSTVELWALMRGCQNAKIKDRAEEFEMAYRWLANNPNVHRTKCSLEIEADWGELQILSPSATIEQDDLGKAPEGTLFESSSVKWSLPPGWKVSPQKIE